MFFCAVCVKATWFGALFNRSITIFHHHMPEYMHCVKNSTTLLLCEFEKSFLFDDKLKVGKLIQFFAVLLMQNLFTIIHTFNITFSNRLEYFLWLNIFPWENGNCELLAFHKVGKFFYAQFNALWIENNYNHLDCRFVDKKLIKIKFFRMIACTGLVL